MLILDFFNQYFEVKKHIGAYNQVNVSTLYHKNYLCPFLFQNDQTREMILKCAIFVAQ